MWAGRGRSRSRPQLEDTPTLPTGDDSGQRVAGSGSGPRVEVRAQEKGLLQKGLPSEILLLVPGQGWGPKGCCPWIQRGWRDLLPVQE